MYNDSPFMNEYFYKVTIKPVNTYTVRFYCVTLFFHNNPTKDMMLKAIQRRCFPMTLADMINSYKFPLDCERNYVHSLDTTKYLGSIFIERLRFEE